ncbi:MAG TPA: STAS/SEC14 domain-containing protein [Ramlibacter sp.]|nr:STAS/SEC14 domain-containing protein [Ramlibacter sp.]
MTATLHYTHGPTFAVVEITALAFLESAEPVLKEIAARTRQHGDRRLLVNLIDVVGTFGPEEQQAIGLLAWRHLSHLEKLASLVPPEKLTRVSEAAAQAQGMQLRVFSELTEAVGWLVEG